jgi:hypothetical protein
VTVRDRWRRAIQPSNPGEDPGEGNASPTFPQATCDADFKSALDLKLTYMPGWSYVRTLQHGGGAARLLASFCLVNNARRQ